MPKVSVIVPIYNVEKYLEKCINSLLSQTLEDIQIILVNDGSKDNSGNIAREYEKNNKNRIIYVEKENGGLSDARNYGLKYATGDFIAFLDSDDYIEKNAYEEMYNKAIEENADYDAFCVFDADNIVDKGFFTAMNKKLCQGEEVVQGYRDIKNPTDSWVSAGYAIFYWTMHRFYHLARYNLGLSALLNGTGFMVKFDIIKPTGWNTDTLTEDIEFSLKRIIQGKRVGWATDAIVYDEQPVGFKQSWSQRSRWTIGHIQCLQEYTKPLAGAVKKNKTLMNFDGLLYMMGSIPMFIMTIVLLLINFVMFIFGGMTPMDLLINCLRYILPTFFLPIFVGIVIMIIERKPIRPMLKGLAFYPLFLGSWLLINFKCLFIRDTKWEKIDHVRDIKIKDVA